MNTQRIEGKGVTAINDFIFSSNFLVPHIDFNDRTASWDGFIFVYFDNTNRKSELIGRIPVQVKASDVKDFSDKIKSKEFDVSDLKNYKNDGGVIIFCVECCGHDKKIYYISLLPYDLNQLLKGLKFGQKSKNICLEHIPKNNICEFETICREFLLHRKKQYSLPQIDFSYDGIKELMIQGVKPTNIIFEQFLISKPQYLYGKTQLNSTLYDCVTKINIEEIKKTLDRPVSVGNKQYYSNYEIISTKDNFQLLFGNDVKFYFGKDKLNISYSPTGKLDERINDTEFIIEFINKRGLQIAGSCIPLLTTNDIKEEEMKGFKKYHKYLVNVAAILSIFKIDNKEIDLNDISEDDSKRMDILINSMVLNNSAPIQKSMPGLYRFEIANLNLLTMVYQNANSKVEIHDINTFNKGKIYLVPKNEENEEKQDASIYLLLGVDDIILCSNIRLSEVIENVISYNHTIEYDSEVLNLALRIIKAYDKNNSIDYLDYANRLLLWIDEGNNDKGILTVNKLQIVKRRRELTIDEIELLQKLKEEEKDNNSMLCGISILLDDIESFNNYYDTMPVAQKEVFKDYPIYSIIKQNK